LLKAAVKLKPRSYINQINVADQMVRIGG